MNKLINDIGFLAIGLIIGLGIHLNIYQNPIVIFISSMSVGTFFILRSEINSPIKEKINYPYSNKIESNFIEKNKNLQTELNIEKKSEANLIDLDQFRRAKKLKFSGRSENIDPAGA